MKPKADVQNARAKAEELLEAFAITAAPIPIERIIKRKQISLQYAPLEEDLSGMAYIKDGLSIIGINALHHPNRQRFSAAHELAHHVLHSEVIKDAVHVDKGHRVLLRDQVSSQGVDALESEANAFASALLMPRELLIKSLNDEGIDIEDDSQIDALAKKFRVSSSAIRVRLAALTNETV
jgi:Zn-dependent peptidase ImmA (M78 family)